MVMTWLAMALMPIGDAMALIYTYPFFVITLSLLYLGQKVGLFKIITSLVTILGAVFIVDPALIIQSEK